MTGGHARPVTSAPVGFPRTERPSRDWMQSLAAGAHAPLLTLGRGCIASDESLASLSSSADASMLVFMRAITAGGDGTMPEKQLPDREFFPALRAPRKAVWFVVYRVVRHLPHDPVRADVCARQIAYRGGHFKP